MKREDQVYIRELYTTSAAIASVIDAMYEGHNAGGVSIEDIREILHANLASVPIGDILYLFDTFESKGFGYVRVRCGKYTIFAWHPDFEDLPDYAMGLKKIPPAPPGTDMPKDLN